MQTSRTMLSLRRMTVERKRARDRQHVSTHNTLRSFDILWTIRPEEKVQRTTLFAKLIPTN